MTALKMNYSGAQVMSQTLFGLHTRFNLPSDNYTRIMLQINALTEVSTYFGDIFSCENYNLDSIRSWKIKI